MHHDNYHVACCGSQIQYSPVAFLLPYLTWAQGMTSLLYCKALCTKPALWP
ncbi:rCG57404 [Rattus norvegicus]|uniref:RCG57404 n=1 Tax=Rattus norvegicus TaxID=10116 RepID=A6JP75_RAT|nr:rCG57404 [Rattus norvegicus]